MVSLLRKHEDGSPHHEMPDLELLNDTADFTQASHVFVLPFATRPDGECPTARPAYRAMQNLMHKLNVLVYAPDVQAILYVARASKQPNAWVFVAKLICNRFFPSWCSMASRLTCR
mmetsp:Transcript_60599/g.198217  ORF Transcript_60599/g.198217 Transcript_60599/m.198217 type:complete len:116 (+) Transcript_60599:83-430(+)